MNFVSFWRNCERMVSFSSVNVWLSSAFGVPVMAFVSFWRMDFVSFWRNCERMGFVSSVFGVPVNVSEIFVCEIFWRTCERLDFDSFWAYLLNVWVSSRQFLAYL